MAVMSASFRGSPRPQSGLEQQSLDASGPAARCPFQLLQQLDRDSSFHPCQT